MIYFPRKYILQKFSNTLYEGCEDPQIWIVKNYKHAAKIGRIKILITILFFKKLVKWQHLNTGSVGFALISECKSNAHTLSFNRFIKKCQILVLCNKQFNIFFILSRWRVIIHWTQTHKFWIMAPKLCDEFWHHNSKCASLSLSSMDKNPLEVYSKLFIFSSQKSC